MNRAKPSVLLVSDSGVGGLPALLTQSDIDLTVTASIDSAAALLSNASFDAVLLEVGQRNAGGLGIRREPELAWVRSGSCDAPLIAYGPPLTELEREALAAGAAGYLAWSASLAEIGLALDSAFARSHVDSLEASRSVHGSGLLGQSTHMLAVRENVVRVGRGSSTVLVRGETGTGKELVARAVHDGSARGGAPFIKVHAAALPDALLESELFGYEKGAFTGANTRKPGRVELAEGGTLFFDEIGEITPVMQAKLLRLLEDREYERLGGTRTHRADVRFVAATHRDLEHMVEAGTFREDLFYRLNVVSVWLPPLRARRGDVALIARHYFEHFRAANHKPALAMQEAALQVLQAQRWPGNVRQLVNFVERLVVLAQSNVITAEDVQLGLVEQLEFLTQGLSQDGHEPALEPKLVLEPTPAASAMPTQPVALDSALPIPGTHLSSAVRPLREEVRRAELRALTKALHSAKGNRALAARLLGVSRRTLYTKLDEHGLD